METETNCYMPLFVSLGGLLLFSVIIYSMKKMINTIKTKFWSKK